MKYKNLAEIFGAYEHGKRFVCSEIYTDSGLAEYDTDIEQCTIKHAIEQIKFYRRKEFAVLDACSLELVSILDDTDLEYIKYAPVAYFEGEV